MKVREKMLPVCSPCGGDEEINALSQVVKSNWFGKGPKVAEFEKEFAKRVGVKYALAVTSNSHGMDLVIKALNIKGGDIISPTVSFLTTAVVPVWNNCTTNVVDVDAYTMCINPKEVKKYLTSNTKAVIAVNLNGVPAPIDEIRKFYDGFVIEDCAHSAPGYANAGTKGDVAIWSFQATKVITSGDGGMITLNDEKLYNKLKEMSWFGITQTYDRLNKKNDLSNKPGYSWNYSAENIGYKCYMIDLTAAICLEQMKKLSKHLKWRQHIQTRYNNELNSVIKRPPWSETVQHYSIKIPTESNYNRNDLIDYLMTKNIHTSVHYKPMHQHGAIQNHLTFENRMFDIADKEWLEMMSLPCHPVMTEEDIDYVIYWVNNYFEQIGEQIDEL